MIDKLNDRDQQLVLDIINTLKKSNANYNIRHNLRNSIDSECGAIWWSVSDMVDIAKQHEKDNDEEEGSIYDYDSIPDAFEHMIYKHDASIGISWDTLEIYLDQYCLKENNNG